MIAKQVLESHTENCALSEFGTAESLTALDLLEVALRYRDPADCIVGSSIGS